MQQLLWVMEKLQDDLSSEEDLKRAMAELADDFRSAVDVLQVRGRAKALETVSGRRLR